MNSSHYERYKSFISKGLRKEAGAEIRLFIDSFADAAERKAFARWFLENEDFGHKIRHELYEAVIFPALVDGYGERDPWSSYWLARTCQNLYQAKHLWRQVGF